MSTYENTPVKKPGTGVKNPVDPVVSGIPPLVQRDFGGMNVQQSQVQTAAVPQQGQPLNIFANGGMRPMGKFESQPDVMPKEPMFEGVQQTVGQMNYRNHQPDMIPQNNGPQQGVAPVAPMMEQGRMAPGARLEPDAMPQKADYMDWNKVGEEYKNGQKGWNGMYAANKENPYNGGPYRYPGQKDSFDQLMQLGKEDKLGTMLKNLDDLEYKADKKKRDGGFFGWIRNNFGNPDRKDGETDDEYNDRVMNNRKKLLILGDSLRQLGNVINAGNGGISQKFNSPIAEFEARQKEKKAEDMAKDKLAADNAYKAASLKMKQGAADADRAYKAAILSYKERDAQRADQKMADDKENKGLNRAFKEWQAKNQFALKKQALGIQDRHNRATEAARWASVGIAQARENRMALKDANGGASSGSFTNIATPTGSLRRKKDLSPIEKKQILNKMRQMGFITKEYEKHFADGVPIQEQGAALNFAIGYAASDKRKKNDKFRDYLIKHHGYTPMTTEGSSAPVASGKASGGKKKKGYGNISI